MKCIYHLMNMNEYACMYIKYRMHMFGKEKRDRKKREIKRRGG